MKLTTRGFTLVELMIVIAIIGILAAALFPSFMNYMAGARDSGRVANLRDFKLAATQYYTNNQSFDALVGTNNCIATGTLAKYMGNKVPVDGTRTHANCNQAGIYATATGKINGADSVAFYAGLESEGKGNTGAASNVSSFGTDFTSSQSWKTGGSQTGFLNVQ